MTETAALHLWTNQTDTLVAGDLDHLLEVFTEYLGCSPEAAAQEFRDYEWEQLDDDEPFEIYRPEKREGPDVISCEHNASPFFSDCPYLISALASTWAKWNGPGVLCSTEW